MWLPKQDYRAVKTFDDIRRTVLAAFLNEPKHLINAP